MRSRPAAGRDVTGSVVTDEAINRGILSETGDLFAIQTPGESGQKVRAFDESVNGPGSHAATPYDPETDNWSDFCLAASVDRDARAGRCRQPASPRGRQRARGARTGARQGAAPAGPAQTPGEFSDGDIDTAVGRLDQPGQLDPAGFAFSAPAARDVDPAHPNAPRDGLVNAEVRHHDSAVTTRATEGGMEGDLLQDDPDKLGSYENFQFQGIDNVHPADQFGAPAPRKPTYWRRAGASDARAGARTVTRAQPAAADPRRIHRRPSRAASALAEPQRARRRDVADRVDRPGQHSRQGDQRRPEGARPFDLDTPVPPAGDWRGSQRPGAAARRESVLGRSDRLRPARRPRARGASPALRAARRRAR